MTPKLSFQLLCLGIICTIALALGESFYYYFIVVAHIKTTNDIHKLYLLRSILKMWPITSLHFSADPKCNETVNDGTGHEKIVKFYYNPQLGFCSPFFYTGEGGNANRFDSDHDCMVSCSPKYQEILLLLCTLKMDPGTCFASIVMYYYDTTEKNCRMFLYRGCQGNGNRFESREDCQTRCRGHGSDLCCCYAGPEVRLIPNNHFYSTGNKESHAQNTSCCNVMLNCKTSVCFFLLLVGRQNEQA
uniref:BPTI/Kunitz inhibitor domain-containing protein n=1 Tax=Electrophorus electricus TaxID=8005 RepID=A0A4W4FSK1_ELEEL